MQQQDAVRIPADVDRPDPLVAGMTARQLAILAITGVLVWLVYLVLSPWVAPYAVALVAVVLAGLGGGLALARRDGVGVDRLLWADLLWWRSPRRLVLAPEGVPELPHAAPAGTWAAGDLAPLSLPVQAISDSGVLDLGDAGCAVIVEASTVSLALKAPHEQQILIGAYARWLNSLTHPVQIVIRSQWVDLTDMITGLHEMAPSLPHPALEAAAREHADFLTELADTCDLSRRQVLLVFTATGKSGAAERAWQMVDAASRALAAAEVTLSPLDGGQVTALLAVCGNPLGPARDIAAGWAGSGQIVTGAPGGPG